MGDLESEIGDATFIDETVAPIWRNDDQGPPRDGGPLRMARALGWFSVSLGAAELAAPRTMARLIGAGQSRRQRRTLRAVGLREIAAGVGLLLRPRPQVNAWVWSRLAGDLMDLAFLRAARRARGSSAPRLLMAAGMVTGAAVVDAITGVRVSRAGVAPDNEVHSSTDDAVEVTEAVTVNRPPEEVFRFWRNLENLPRFMVNVESVTVQDQRRSHWCARTVGGRKVEWDAEIVDVQDGRLISWRSLPASDVANDGMVRFRPAPGQRGTEVRVNLRYRPPAGKWSATVAKLLGKAPGQQVRADLHRFKQVMETGEVIKSDASIHRGTHPAQPAPADASGCVGNVSVKTGIPG